MKANGITINDVYADNLVIHATGTVAQFNRVFSTSIHDFEDEHGRHFRGHLGQFLIPQLLQDIVLTVPASFDDSQAISGTSWVPNNWTLTSSKSCPGSGFKSPAANALWVTTTSGPSSADGFDSAPVTPSIG